MNILNRCVSLIAMIALFSTAPTLSMQNVDPISHAQVRKKTKAKLTLLQIFERLAKKTGSKAAQDMVTMIKQFKSVLPKKLIKAAATKEPRRATCDELIACSTQLCKNQKVILAHDKNTVWAVVQDELVEKDVETDFSIRYRTIILVKAPTTFLGFIIKRHYYKISRIEFYYKGQGLFSATKSRPETFLGFLPKACMALGSVSIAALAYCLSGTK